MPIDKLPGLYDSESVRGWRLIKAGLYFILGAGFLVWMLLHPAKSPKELLDRGTLIEARVYRIDRDKKDRDLISYGFTIEGNTYSIENRRVADTDGLTKLGPIDVWYDPGNPNYCVTRNELRYHEQQPGRIWGFGVIAVMMLLAVYQIAASLRSKGSLLST